MIIFVFRSETKSFVNCKKLRLGNIILQQKAEKFCSSLFDVDFFFAYGVI